ncbi:MAG: YwiC-like family protein, partial [Chloroflexota bacterium]
PPRAVLCLYLARYPLFLWARGSAPGFAPPVRRWFIVYLGIGLGLAGWLIFGYGMWLLIPLGAMGSVLLLGHLYLSRKHQERSMAGEFLGIAGLLLSAPVAVYAASGQLNSVAFWLWFLSLAFFTTSIFYVKMKVEEFSSRGGAGSQTRHRLSRFLIWYQAGAIAVVLLLSYLGLIPTLTVVAFIPVAFQTAWGILKPVKQLRIKRLGWSQVGQSALFFGLLVLVYRISEIT